jgi:hypothetical protein
MVGSFAVEEGTVSVVVIFVVGGARFPEFPENRNRALTAGQALGGAHASRSPQ